MSLWGVIWVQEVLGLVEAVCWTLSWSVLCWGCSCVVLAVEWLQRLKHYWAPQRAGHHLALPHQHPPEH